jgi:hypothetical protein
VREYETILCGLRIDLFSEAAVKVDVALDELFEPLFSQEPRPFVMVVKELVRGHNLGALARIEARDDGRDVRPAVFADVGDDKLQCGAVICCLHREL